MQSTRTPYDTTRHRGEFPVTQQLAYLDHASVGPMPRRSAQAICERLTAQSARGSLEHPGLHDLADQCRADYAAYIGARPDQVCYTASTSAGISTIAAGLDWREGDEVVVPDIEFPSAVLPWMALRPLGVAVRPVPCPDGHARAEALIAACSPRTRAVCASWVQFSSGCVLDLARLGEACRARGIVLVIDGMQGVGALPLCVADLPVDALVTQNYKWLLGPQGVGWLYVADPLRARLRVTAAGVRGMRPRTSYLDHRFDPRDDAMRFETGILPFHLIAGVQASLLLLRDAHAGGAGAHIQTLSARIAEGLLRNGCELRGGPDRRDFQSGIVAFRPRRGDAAACHRRLLQAGIVTAEREGHVRVAAHFYNTADEADALIERVRELA